MNPFATYVYTFIGGMLFFYCVSAYIYYRLTKLVLTKFEDSFVHIDIGNITKKALFFYYVVFVIIGVLQWYLLTDVLSFELQYVLVFLSFPVLWKILPFKENETESKLIVIAHLVITPTLLTYSLVLGWGYALTKVVEIMYA